MNAIEAVKATRFAVRLQDDVTDLLAEVTVSDIDEHGQLAMAWRCLTDSAELLKHGPSMAGRVVDASGHSAARALVWIDGPGLEQLPFALRSTYTGADGAFVLPRPAHADLPLMCHAASPDGAAAREVQAATEPEFRGAAGAGVASARALVTTGSSADRAALRRRHAVAPRLHRRAARSAAAAAWPLRCGRARRLVAGTGGA
ncbi:MAG: hypothetical protein U1E76_15010 [Planctomycetota bacterium]